MALLPMAPGGRWVRPPHDGPPVYVPAKQATAHLKRLFADGWMPIDDPRREEGMQQAQAHVQAEVARVSTETAMQARIDQLEALVRQLLTQKSEQHDDSTHNDGDAHHEGSADDRRSNRRKPAV